MMDAPSIAAFGAIFTALVVTFLKFVNDNRKSQDKRDETFARSLNALTVSNKAIATATQKQAKEAEDRNGHLADIAMENKKSNYEQSREILKAINTLPTQHIAVQTVDNQVIKEVE